MQENYKILNVSPDATDEEVIKAYETLKAQYSQDRFLEGEAGNKAAKNLTKLEAAYYEIMESRSEKTTSNGDDSLALEEVERLIKQGNVTDAQERLDAFNDRNAEWHYLQSVVFYKKGWMNESLKQLEIALSMDSDNAKYKTAFNKMQQKISASEAQFKSGDTTYNGGNTQQNTNYNAGQSNNRQMGGTDCDCCSTCAAWCCADMMCSMCCH